jgi:alkylhydroperoxidase/carboxymuconolactone decarboxylase family protein YurZ
MRHATRLETTNTPAAIRRTFSREDIRYLSERERKLVQLALEIGTMHKAGVIAQARACRQLGLTPTELIEVALLAVNEIDCPRALSWINDGLESDGDE